MAGAYYDWLGEGVAFEHHRRDAFKDRDKQGGVYCLSGWRVCLKDNFVKPMSPRACLYSVTVLLDVIPAER